MSRPVKRARRGVRAAGVTSLLLAAGLLSACASTPASAPTAASGALMPGITGDTVAVGYTVGNDRALSAALGVNSADQGDVELQTRAVRAYVNFVNRLGGAGGRQIDATVSAYGDIGSGPEQAQALCTGFTQSAKVFAAVLDDQYSDSALPCYRAARTLVVDETLVAHDQAQFDENAPYLWSPTHPEYSGFLEAQLQTMRGQGFFDGVDDVQVIAADDAVSARMTRNVVLPFLSRLGIGRTEVSPVDVETVAGRAVGTAAALTAGTEGGYDRVIVVGGARIMPVALAEQDADYYLSTWGISTWDEPDYISANSRGVVLDRVRGTSGLGYAPAFDTSGTRGGPFPDPARPAEGVCKGVLDAAGITIGAGQRANYRTAFQYCDATLFLKAALDQAPSGSFITADQFRDAVGRIGTKYASSLTFGSEFEPGQYAATNAGRVLTFDASCACFTYKGDDVPITAS